MRRAAVAVVRALAPLYGAVDRWVSSWVGRRELLLFVAHFDPAERTPDAARTIERQISRIRETCHLLPLGEALELLARDELPPRPAVLFVDDATRPFYETGYPILRRLDVPFVLAILPGLIPADDHVHALAVVMRVANQGRETPLSDVAGSVRRVTGATGEFPTYDSFFRSARELDRGRLEDLRADLGIPEDPLMTWQEVAVAKSESRVELANHSMSHPLMKHVAGEWLAFEVVESSARIRERLAITVRDFVFPYGTRENATPVVVDALRRAGYRGAYLVRMGVARRGAFLMPRSPLEARPPLDEIVTSHALNTLASLARL